MSAKPNTASQRQQEKLQQHLNDLRLFRIAETYPEVLDEAARKQTSMLDVLALLIADEAHARSERALLRRVKAARLPKRKTLQDYDFTWPDRVPKEAILRLFDCDFIERHGNAALIGSTGLGKTHLLTALGYKACDCGYSVRYTRVVEMINMLIAAQLSGHLEKTIRTYTRPNLLLLDELGYLAIDKRGADLLFQVVATRYESGSIVLTTNRIFQDWGKTLDQDSTVATAMIDRLMHHGEALVIKGETYRNPEKKMKPQKRTK
jgi:DNA replication protein DnaC